MFNPFNSNTPFSSPSRLFLNNLNKTTPSLKKFSLTSFLDNASKSVNTINQIIPLYKEVKPLINTSKKYLSSLKKETKVETPTIKEEKLETKAHTTSKKVELTPDKPFFV